MRAVAAKRVNAYAGTCDRCGSRVKARQGLLRWQDGAWIVEHETCGAQDNEEGEAGRQATWTAEDYIADALATAYETERRRSDSERDAEEDRLTSCREERADALAAEYDAERVRLIDAEYGLTPGARDIT